MNLKLKYILSLCCLLLLAQFGYGQKVDFNKVVVPVESRARTFPEWLVQLAWMNNPSNDILARKIDIAKEDVKIQKFDWAKDFDALFNYNEAHFIKDFVDPEGRDPIIESLIYPRFNFGARISLGTLLNHGNEKKKAEIDVTIAELEHDQEKLAIRAKVLERYEKYLLAKAILITRKQAEEDSYQTYELVNELFKNGQAEFEEVNAASTSYFSSKESFMTAETEVKIAKIQVEEMIGISLEDAKRYGPKEDKDKKSQIKKEDKTREIINKRKRNSNRRN